MSKQYTESPICNDTRPCFGAQMSPGGFRRCLVLSSAYEKDGQCPYCKEAAEDIVNTDIRALIFSKGLLFKQVALRMGISTTRFHSILSAPLSEKARKRIKKAVMELEEERDKYVQSSTVSGGAEPRDGNK